MEEVLIHTADLDNGKGGKPEEEDAVKVEMTDSRRNIIRMGTCIFLWTIVICIFIILVQHK